MVWDSLLRETPNFKSFVQTVPEALPTAFQPFADKFKSFVQTVSEALPTAFQPFTENHGLKMEFVTFLSQNDPLYTY
jgi:hypothetical protein